MDHNNILDVKSLLLVGGALILSNLDAVKEFFQIFALGTAIIYNVVQAGIAIKRYKNNKKNKDDDVI